MAMGIVGYSGLTTREVAPNSPNDTVKANTAAERVARATIGQSTENQARLGEAPNEAAAYFNFSGIEARAGCKLRMTNGRAIIVWARGTNHGEAINAKGGVLKVMIKPSPRVTAEAPNGSISNGSSNRSSRPGRAKAAAAGKPSPRDNTTVKAAYPRELPIASNGGT